MSANDETPTATPAADLTLSIPAVEGNRRVVARGVLLLFLIMAISIFLKVILAGTPPAGPSSAVVGAYLLRAVSAISLLAVPLTLAFFPLYAAVRGIKVYEEFVEGAKEGFQVALRIIPFLVAMLVAIGMFRGSGGMNLLTEALRPVLGWIGFPPDLLPLVLMLTMSGSGTQ